MAVNRLYLIGHSALLLALGGCHTEGRATTRDGEPGERERFRSMAECVDYANRWVTYECRRYEFGYLRETREWVAGEWVRTWPEPTAKASAP